MPRIDWALVLLAVLIFGLLGPPLALADWLRRLLNQHRQPTGETR